MGILDDAIREHLDLKRRRGADPAEIERAEREALGPVRRGPEDVGLAEQLEEPPAGEEQLDYEEDGEEGWGESFDEETRLFGEEREPAFGHVPAAAPEQELEPPIPGEEPAFEDEPASEHDLDRPQPPTPPEPSEPRQPPSRPAAQYSEETAEYDVAHELDEKGEDVLEETPEFLQDTPDHDRLWFEQRPPRDFDFEG